MTDELNEKLYRYYDNEMDAKERAAFETLLAARPDWRQEIEAWKRTAQKVFPKKPAAVPRGFVFSVMNRIENEMEARTSNPFLSWVVPSVGLAAAMVLFALTFQTPANDAMMGDLVYQNLAESWSPL